VKTMLALGHKQADQKDLDCGPTAYFV